MRKLLRFVSFSSICVDAELRTLNLLSHRSLIRSCPSPLGASSEGLEDTGRVTFICS